jgi:DNA-binding SARP family transcriptional activator
VPITSARQRAMMAAFLLRPNRAVSVHRLAGSIWGERPPRSAAGLVHNYVWRLRLILSGGAEPDDRILRDPAGYRLVVRPGELDTTEFDHLAAAGRRALTDRRDAVAADTLRAALRLWRGEPLEDVALCDHDAEAETHRLAESRLTALEDRIDADLRLGRAGELIGELRRLVTLYPYRERMTEQLMLVLHRAGRQVEALAVYREAAARLRTEMGLDVGPRLARLHRNILKGALAPAPSPVVPGPAVPRQLPLGASHFVGRADEIRQLDAWANDPEGAPIATLTGPAGIGTSALAVHWARQTATPFPDGRLHLDLHGFAPDQPPMDTSEALACLLTGIGLSGELPTGVCARSALWRGTTADTRLLLILDNVRDSMQVRPLLPGGPSCRVLVTSRSMLAGLVAVEGGHPVRLGELSAAEAHSLLTLRLGVDRTTAEPAAIDELIELCGRWPLPLALAAAKAVLWPATPLVDLVTLLRDRSRRLDVLDTAEPNIGLRSAFDRSYQLLSPRAARMFRCAGDHPGPYIAADAAARAAGMRMVEARPALAELVHAHLLGELGPDRFACSGLLRDYAAELRRATNGGVPG